MARWEAKHEFAYRAFSRAVADGHFPCRTGINRVQPVHGTPAWAVGRCAGAPDIDNIQQMLFHYSLLPRLAISLLVGAGLGLVGVLFQQVLRNPLAEPTTLGVATGAQLGITITTLWALPGALTSQFAALAGACVVGALVFGVAWGNVFHRSR
jgi:ABC-type Fe3+-siderophore transport system permease subunit